MFKICPSSKKKSSTKIKFEKRTVLCKKSICLRIVSGGNNTKKTENSTDNGKTGGLFSFFKQKMKKKIKKEIEEV